MLDLTPENFSKEVQDTADTMGEGFIDAILHKCEEYHIEPEFASSLLSKSIIDKLHNEGIDMNLLPKTAQLPV
jgi:hypothetical protein